MNFTAKPTKTCTSALCFCFFLFLLLSPPVLQYIYMETLVITAVCHGHNVYFSKDILRASYLGPFPKPMEVKSVLFTSDQTFLVCERHPAPRRPFSPQLKLGHESSFVAAKLVWDWNQAWVWAFFLSHISKRTIHFLPDRKYRNAAFTCHFHCTISWKKSRVK